MNRGLHKEGYQRAYRPRKPAGEGVSVRDCDTGCAVGERRRQRLRDESKPPAEGGTA